MDAKETVQGQFERAYRRPEWVGAGIKYGNPTVAMAGLRSSEQLGNASQSFAYAADAAPANVAIALFRAGYEDVVRTWGAAPAKEEGLS